MLKKILGITVKIFISVALIWYVLGDIDFDSAIQKIQNADLRILALAVFVFYLQLIIGALRWQAVNTAIGALMSFRDAIRIFFIGIFFSQALPGGTGGDAVRVYLAYKGGLELRGALNGVMLERIAAVVALVLLVDVAQPFFQMRITAADADWVASSAVLLTLGAVAGLGLIMTIDRFFRNFLTYKIVRGFSYLSADTRAVFLKPKNLFFVTLWGIVGHINLSFCVYIIALSLSLDVTLVDCLMLVPPVLLIVAIPISIGGWGVREYAMVAAFGLIGVPKEGATVLSILVGLIGIAISLPGGLVWLLSRDSGKGKSISEMESEISRG